jgi:hypothetical protein
MRSLVATLFVAVLALTGCASTNGKPSGAATATRLPHASSSVTAPLTGRSPVADDPATAPREAASPDPNFDYGFVVQITPKGFHPQWLVSGCCKPVTWRNLTGDTVSVVFDHQLVDSGPIAPGGTFVFTPHNVQSIAYHAGTNPSMIGVLQVNQTFES